MPCATNWRISGNASVLRTTHDKYARTLADVLLPDGTNVNQELVKAGLVLVVSEVCARGYGAGATREGSTRGEERLVG